MPASSSSFVSWRARSGRKLKKIAVSSRLEPRPAVEHRRLDELVGHALLVARPHRRDRVVGVLALALHDRVEGLLRPLPALVAVHRVVAAGDGRDPLGGQFGEVALGRVRRDVAAVGESMDPRRLGPEPQQRLQVLEVGVHTAARDETEQVHVAAPVERRLQGGVLEEGAVGDRAVDPLQVLIEHAARADRQVADLRVAHLAGRQADRLAARP